MMNSADLTTLQGLAVLGCAAPIPHCDAPSQDALYCASVEVGEDDWVHATHTHTHTHTHTNTHTHTHTNKHSHTPTPKTQTHTHTHSPTPLSQFITHTHTHTGSHTHTQLPIRFHPIIFSIVRCGQNSW